MSETEDSPDGNADGVQGPESSPNEALIAEQQHARVRFVQRLNGVLRSAMNGEVSRAVLGRTWQTATDATMLLFPHGDQNVSISRFATGTPTLAERVRLATALDTTRPFPELHQADALQEGLRVAQVPGERQRLALLCAEFFPLKREILTAFYSQQPGFPHPPGKGAIDGRAFEEAIAGFQHAPQRVVGSIADTQRQLESAVIEEAVGAEEARLLLADVDMVPARRAAIQTHIRWMIRRDMPDVLRIAQCSFEYSWKEEDFLRCLRQKNCIGMVAEHGESVIGYMIYELHRAKLQLLIMEVHPEWRMGTVGAQMCAKLFGKLSSRRRTAIDCILSGSNISGRVFLQRQGFKIRRLVPGVSKDSKVPGVHMRYGLQSDSDDQRIVLLEKIFGRTCIGKIMGIDEGDERKNEHEDASGKGGDQEQDPTVVLENLLRIAGECAEFRYEAMQAFRSWAYAPDQHMVSMSLREGWKNLADIHEVSDAEWIAYLKKSAGQTADLPHLDAEEPAEENLRRLDSVIQCQRHQQELERLRLLKNVIAQDAKEKAIIHEVFAATMKYPYATHDRRSGFPPAYRVGTPNHTVSNRVINCFTGPWLTATMLLKCGIPYNQIFFCRANDPRATCFDGHGALLIRTCNNDLMVLDTAYRRIGQPLKLKYANTKTMAENLQFLLEGKKRMPISFEISKEKAEELRLPYRMQIVPPAEGFAAVHMLHVGLSFAHEKRWDEAAHAFELGLSYNAIEPNLHYELGLAAFVRHDLETAKECLRRALTIDDDLLFSYFTLGEVALAENDPVEARRLFQIFARDMRQAFGDDGTMKMRAESYLSCTNEEMLTVWKDLNERANPGQKSQGGS